MGARGGGEAASCGDRVRLSSDVVNGLAGAALLLVASRLAARSVLLAGPSILAALMCVAAFILGCADWSAGRPAHARRAGKVAPVGALRCALVPLLATLGGVLVFLHHSAKDALLEYLAAEAAGGQWQFAPASSASPFWAQAGCVLGAAAAVNGLAANLGHPNRVRVLQAVRAASSLALVAAVSACAIAATLGYGPAALRPSSSDAAHVKAQLPAWLHRLGRWEANDVEWRASGSTLLAPNLAIRRPVPVNQSWHVLDLDEQTRRPRVSELDTLMERPVEVLIGYCHRAAVRAWEGRIKCSSSPVLSAAMLQTYVPGVTLLGFEPKIYAWQHEMLNGLPQLGMALGLAAEIFGADSDGTIEVRLLCSPVTCAAARTWAARKNLERRLILVEVDKFAGQKLGHLCEHLIFPMSSPITSAEYVADSVITQQGVVVHHPKHPRDFYPLHSFDVARGLAASAPSSTNANLVIVITREDMTQLSIGWRNAQNRARVLEAADRERFISLLNRTLQTTYPRLELRIFTRPAGLGNDAALFSRARMVVAVHGGALSNTVVCRPGTIVVEVLPKFNPRAYFLAVSYAQGFSHYAYTRSGPKFWDYYDTARKLSWLNVTDLHGYVATALGDGEFHSAQ